MNIKLRILHPVILIFMVLMISIMELKSQSSIGVKAGGTYSTIDLSTLPAEVSLNYTIGSVLGIIYKNQHKKNLGLQLEANFIQKGWDQENTTSLESIERIVNYFNVTMLSQLYFGRKKTRVFINAGPFLGYALSSSVTESVNGGESKYAYDFDPHEDNRYEYGLIGGAGISRKIGFGNLHLEGRYFFGFNNLFNPYDDQVDFTQSKIMGFAISLGYLVYLNANNSSSP